VVKDITGEGHRDQRLSFNRSISCGGASRSSLEDDEDAVWPGLKRSNEGAVDPDIIVEHRRRPPSAASNSINQEPVSLEDSSGLNSSCCSLDVDVDLDGDTFQEVQKAFPCPLTTASTIIISPFFRVKSSRSGEGFGS